MEECKPLHLGHAVQCNCEYMGQRTPGRALDSSTSRLNLSRF